MQNGLKIKRFESIKKITLPLSIFLGLLLLFTAYFLERHRHEIFSKDLTWPVIIEYISYGTLSFILYSGIFTVLLTTSISFNKKPRIPTTNFNNGFLILITTLTLFTYAGFFQPKIYKKQLSIMYDVALKLPDGSLIRKPGLFDNNVATLNLWELSESINSKNDPEITKTKWTLTKMVGWPISGLFFFVFGSSVGILTRKKHWFWTIPINLFLTIPFWWYTKKYFEQLAAYGYIPLIAVLIIPVILLLIVCLGIMWKYKKSLTNAETL
ncbi:MAG: hypothetical protein MI921_12885 [Cytophagales bacterium]|nr:hypothetical protein [Cytophagales bacterium]